VSQRQGDPEDRTTSGRVHRQRESQGTPVFVLIIFVSVLCVILLLSVNISIPLQYRFRPTSPDCFALRGGSCGRVSGEKDEQKGDRRTTSVEDRSNKNKRLNE